MVTLRTSVSFKDSPVLLAFPGLGLVGTISGRYLVEKLGLKWTGYVHSRSLPPVGKVKEGKLLYPINVFSGEDIHVILSEVGIPEEEVWELAGAIVSKARKDGAKIIYILSGVLMPGGEGVFGIPSNQVARKVMEENNIKPIENGVITGVSAAVLLLARESGVPALLVLGPASNRQDFEASIRVVDAISRLTGKEVPLEELREMAHKYEHEIRMLQKKLETPQTPIYG